MGIYQKKTVVVDGIFQWTEPNVWPDLYPFPDPRPEFNKSVRFMTEGWAVLHTIHNGQTVKIENGDYIIPEKDGIHFYPCKPDVFDATYEKLY